MQKSKIYHLICFEKCIPLYNPNSRFLKLDTILNLNQFFVIEAVLGVVGCLATSLSSNQ